MHDILITNGHVLTMDAAFTEYPEGSVAISDGVISAVGEVSETNAKETVDAQGGLIIPGLINTHCHAAMTLFRGLADDRPLGAFLQTVWAAEAAHITPETAQIGGTLGAAEMALGGVTHFVDMYWHWERTIAAADHIGISLTTGPVFIAFDGIDDQPWDSWLANAVDAITRLPDQHLMLMLHSCYTMDAGKLRAVSDLATDTGLPIHIHAAEAPSEMEQVHNIYGKRPIAVIQDTGILDHATLIAYAVQLNDAEIAFLAETKATIAHNPLSNAKLASGTMRLKDLYQAGLPLSLGTDGPSSSNDLDMWQAMPQASLTNFAKTGDAESIPARDVFTMATIGGARCIGLAASKGSLEVGKDADLAIIDTTAPHLIPSYDPHSTLVYTAGRGDVAHVVAQGRHVMRDKTLTARISEIIDAVQCLKTKIAP